jgi:3-hydroxyisobutyrate dehydrogenase
MTTVGFIGLGSQGGGMAERIIEMGLPTTLWARRAPTLEPFRGRAAFAADPVELGRSSDIVGICVTDGAAVREVTLGAAGVLAGMAKGSVLALHSTIGTDECAEIADAAARHGVNVIDAPVSGGGAAAAAGALTVYVGGAEASVERARPVLETYGNPVLHMGALGSGLRTKLVNNALNAAHFALAHDAMTIGQALDLDVQKLGDALKSGSGRSFSLEVFVALGSFDAIADHVGPILSKDIGLFARETEPSTPAPREVLLGAADRFLALVGHPRPANDSDRTEVPR